MIELSANLEDWSVNKKSKKYGITVYTRRLMVIIFHSQFFLKFLKGQSLNLFLAVTRFKCSMEKIYKLMYDDTGMTPEIPPSTN